MIIVDTVKPSVVALMESSATIKFKLVGLDLSYPGFMEEFREKLRPVTPAYKWDLPSPHAFVLSNSFKTHDLIPQVLKNAKLSINSGTDSTLRMSALSDPMVDEETGVSISVQNTQTVILEPVALHMEVWTKCQFEQHWRNMDWARDIDQVGYMDELLDDYVETYLGRSGFLFDMLVGFDSNDTEGMAKFIEAMQDVKYFAEHLDTTMIKNLFPRSV